MISLTQGLLEARPRGEQRLQTMVNMKTVILHSTISLKQINAYGNYNVTYEYRIDFFLHLRIQVSVPVISCQVLSPVYVWLTWTEMG